MSNDSRTIKTTRVKGCPVTWGAVALGEYTDSEGVTWIVSTTANKTDDMAIDIIELYGPDGRVVMYLPIVEDNFYRMEFTPEATISVAA